MVDSFETRDNLLRVQRAFSRVERLIRNTGKTVVTTIHVEGSPDAVTSRIQKAVLDGMAQRGVIL